MTKLNRTATTPERIKYAMEMTRKRQVDLVNGTGLNRSTISRYVSGECEPKADAINKLATVLGVNEMWLWGYDVPMERKKENSLDKRSLTEGEMLLLDLFNQVPEESQQMVIDMIKIALKKK